MADMLDEWKAVIRRIRMKEDRYSPEAYLFLAEALTLTVARLPETRHLNAGELIDGFIGLAFERFGLMAGLVIERWGISTSSDIGEIVSQLIQENVLVKRDEDSIEEFKDLRDLIGILSNPRHYNIME